jgi:hypothetical protein
MKIKLLILMALITVSLNASDSEEQVINGVKGRVSFVAEPVQPPTPPVTPEEQNNDSESLSSPLLASSLTDIVMASTHDASEEQVVTVDDGTATPPSIAIYGLPGLDSIEDLGAEHAHSPSNELLQSLQHATLGSLDMDRLVTPRHQALIERVEQLENALAQLTTQNYTGPQGEPGVVEVNDALVNALFALPGFREKVGIEGANRYRSDKVVLKSGSWRSRLGAKLNRKKKKKEAPESPSTSPMGERNISPNEYSVLARESSASVSPIPGTLVSASRGVPFSLSQELAAFAIRTSSGGKKITAAGASDASFDAIAQNAGSFDIVPLGSDDEKDE